MKTWSKTSLKLVGLTLAVCTLFTGCVGKEVQYEVASYQGELAEGETKSAYNKELFYRNDKQNNIYDPFVLDNTERDGYYYMYGTKNHMFCYRSRDLMDWETVGNALGEWQFKSDGSLNESAKVVWTDIWAPEVIYDEETENYYMFFSATPQADDTVSGTNTGNATKQLMVAVSKYPDRDFQLVNFKDAASCGKANVRKYNESAYPQYYAKYFLFDPTSNASFFSPYGGENAGEGNGGYIVTIDPHPYVDENGDKYLFWVAYKDRQFLCGVKMKNWLTPDWSTATVLLCPQYYTVSDWKTVQAGGTVETVPYELESRWVNEGPTLLYRNGTYYMTFSANGYQDNYYQVGVAVADSVLGTYRKLTVEEGGLLLSGKTSGSQEISGTGHHGFVTIGEQLYIVYHRHDDPGVGGGNRNHAIDEIKWITIKDKDGNDLDVMYANGPTCSVQPKIEAYSEYKNIADEAIVTASEDTKVEDISSLTDGLLSIYKFGDGTFMQNVKETAIKETTTFTFDFDSARTVRAVMVYNSKMENTSFINVSKVEFVCEENGKEVIRYIEDIKLSSEYYKQNDFDGLVYYNVPGAAAYAEFDELNVTSIRITVEIPKGQEAVGISEIKILGK